MRRTGVWHVVPTLQDADDSKRLAIIPATTESGDGAVESKHAVVFEHAPRREEIEEA